MGRAISDEDGRQQVFGAVPREGCASHAFVRDERTREMFRIASQPQLLAQQSLVPEGDSLEVDPVPEADVSPSARSHLVSEILKSRRRREQILNLNIFADPAWDIILDLYRANLSNERVTISSAVIAANVPATTGLRWISSMEKQGLLTSTAHPTDNRCRYVDLAPSLMTKLDRYFDWLMVSGNRRQLAVI